MGMYLAGVRIVLVNTSHPGNIGAAARAMKNMGLDQLALVNPAQFPHADATARASGADDLLANASVYPSLEQAIADCSVVYATSARCRSLPWPLVSPREAAKQIFQRQSAKTAIVFGNERSGLTNDELSVAQTHIHIPTAENFSSLNLAAAVQVIVYELFCAAQTATDQTSDQQESRELISSQQMQGLVKHFEAVMTQVDFLDPHHPKLLLKRLQRLLHRATLDTTELNIMRGLLSAVEYKLKKLSRSLTDKETQ